MYGLLLLGTLLGVLVSFSTGPIMGFGLSFGALGLAFGLILAMDHIFVVIRNKLSNDAVLNTPANKNDPNNRFKSTQMTSEASSKNEAVITEEGVMHTKRYWGIALLGILSACITVILNVDSPGRGAFALVISVLIVYYASKGKLYEVATTATWGLLVLVILTLFFYYKTDGVSLLPQPFKTRFFLSYGGSALTLLIILSLTSAYRSDAGRKRREDQPTQKMSPTVQQKPAPETEIPIEIKQQQPDRGATYVDASTSRLEDGHILLEYDDQVRLVYAGLAGLSQEIKDQFLIKVVESPQANITDLRNTVLLNALGRPDLNWDQELEDLIQNCKGANPDDVQELFRVFPVLSKRMSPAKVFKKVVGGDNEEFEVVKADNRTTTVIRRHDGRFLVELSFGRRIFSSDQEVYEYLGTPQNKRNSLPRS